MKLQQALLVTALSLSVFVGHSSAQDSDSVGFGKGRLLKKMRNDIMNFKPKFKLPSFKSNKTASAKPQFKFPTPGRSGVPTPALPSASSRPASIDSAAYRHPIKPAKKAAEKSLAGGSSSTQYQARSSSAPVTKSTMTPEAVERVTRSGKTQSQAFGMLLQTQGENLVVTQLNPAGNASKAGVRKGDVILGVGGLEVDSMLAFNEITSVLKDGDSLELLVSQSGKETKKLVSYGKAVQVVAKGTAPQSQFTAPANRTARNPVARTSSLNQYELVSPGGSMPSVIESSQPAAAVDAKAAPQSWKYNSGRRNSQKQIEALNSAAARGETILNVSN